jgi:hypothetical protein
VKIFSQIKIKKMKPNKLLSSLAILSIVSVVLISSCTKDDTNPLTMHPTVISTDAANNATNVVLNKIVTAKFSVPMDQLTLTAETFTIKLETTPIAGSITYADSTATFTPAESLLSGVTYTATITTGARNVPGTALARDYVWTFSTLTVENVITVQSSVMDMVPLAGAADYAILAGSAITNTGATNITGDIGLSPGSSVGGFPPGIYVGTLVSISVAALAKTDLTAAYNNAAARVSTDIVTLSGNIGGLTLTPGLYKTTSSLAISSGDLTFDAQGNANAVFIIQIASSLTTTSGRKVILAGGALASNIFWNVGSSATFGTTSVFKGTVLVMQSITFNTGATLDGRALARTGGVTMAGNTIVKQ